MKLIKRLHQYLNLLWLILFSALGCLQVAAFEQTDAAVDADQKGHLEKGRDIYNFHCYFCHGYAGDAKTLAAKFLNPPPRDFTTSDPNELTRERMQLSVRDGRPNTAMKPFRGILTEQEIEAVTRYVHSAFIVGKLPNTRYHTVENGWYDHERFRNSYPFATGEIPLDSPVESLSENQRQGLRVYLNSCISCHDRSQVDDPTITWESIAISYPRLGFQTGDSLLPPDAQSGASPFAKHDIAPSISDLTSTERLGETLFQQNCAFCHAADGTGKNWIGTFLRPHPRDLTDPQIMTNLSREQIKLVIRNGLVGTSMPAWKSVLTDAQIDALVHYIHRAFHPLAGLTD
ncbi:MAG: cytochrome c [Candidatus Thiodiazotropha lotti]|nr:cytochrome c [Candidatus Thiodiazotropha lotti]